MKEKLNEINQDINHMMELMSKYPFLSENLNQVIARLNSQKKELEEMNSLEDLPAYKGEYFNRIDREKDDLSVIKAKLKAQQEWIERNVE